MRRIALFEKENAGRPALAVLVKGGMPMEEALTRADEAGLAIASNKRLSAAIVGSDAWRAADGILPCWTGTMTAYEMPGRKLGKRIEYRDSDTGVRFIFPVPEELQGKGDIILVAEHPGFKLLKEGRDRIVQASEVHAVERFPVTNEGWLLGDPRYDIPQGNIADCRNQDARYFWRVGRRVGLVARDYGNGRGGADTRGINLGSRPSLGLGVLVESPGI